MMEANRFLLNGAMGGFVRVNGEKTNKPNQDPMYVSLNPS
jgi:hypothetical protein